MSQEIHELSGEPFELSKLIWKYLQREITAEEKALLDEWAGRSEGNKKWFDELADAQSLQQRLSTYHALTEGREQAWKKIQQPGKIAGMRWIILAAASVLLAISLVVFTWNKRDEQEKAIVQNKNEISAPASNKAVLSLDDGRKFYLDSVGNGVLVSKNNVNIEKLDDGRLAYRQQAGVQAMVYNTLSNPRGSKVIDITLADGSRVWLNNESSVRFPLAFGDGERKVVITGEAYFEVVKDAKRKFVVEAGGSTIEVLGTHFNVNAYENDIISLLEGSVRAKKNAGQVILEPGQQAKITGNSIQLITDTDVQDAVAWKNGLIVFDHTDIHAIFKQIERWYDVEVVVNGQLNVPEGVGELPRHMNLSEVLQVLEINSKLSFKIEGKKVIVLP